MGDKGVAQLLKDKGYRVEAMTIAVK